MRWLAYRGARVAVDAGVGVLRAVARLRPTAMVYVSEPLLCSVCERPGNRGGKVNGEPVCGRCMGWDADS